MKKKSIFKLAAGMFSVFALTLLLTFFQFFSPNVVKLGQTKSIHRANENVSETTRQEVEAFKPITDYDDDFGASIQQSAHTSRAQAYVVKFTSEVYNFMLGYYPEDEEQYPFSLSYYYTNKAGERKEGITEFEVNSTVNNYDAVGPDIGSDSLTFYLDIDLEEGDIIDRDSLIFFNVFYLQYNAADKTFSPKFEENLTIKKIKTTSSAKEDIDLDKHFTTELKGISSFGNFLCFDVTFDNHAYDLYYSKKADYVDNKYKEELDEGKFLIVYDFPALSNASLTFYYSTGEVIHKRFSQMSVTSSLRIDYGMSQVKFVVDNIPLENLERVAMNSLSFKIRIVTKEDKEQAGTAFTTRFASLWFKTNTGTLEGVSQINIVLILIIAEAAYIVVFVALALIYYFYAKNKYKNDEFRRVNTREYVKTSIIAGFGVDVLILDLLVIIFRFGAFNNRITVFNPIDNFVVVLSVALIFFIGYFAKRAVASVKESHARREAKRLKLNEKSEETDGTN